MISPTLHGSKRLRQSSHDESSPSSTPGPGLSPGSVGDELARIPLAPAAAGGGHAARTAGHAGVGTNFRNVSACNRCRLRKNRCDQRLPSCESCDKARVPCVGYDPITKTEIPRSYVYYLENRVEVLESILRSNNIPHPPAENLELCSRQATAIADVLGPGPASRPPPPNSIQTESAPPDRGGTNKGGYGPGLESHKRRRRSSGHGTAGGSAPNPAIPRSLASASGVSFARVVLAAVQNSFSDQNANPGRQAAAAALHGPADGGGTSMRDSFFGLHTRPTTTPAAFPDKELGLRLARLYFEHANPQVPILHRGEFMRVFEMAYSPKAQIRGPRELYVLNMVFAIGSGSIVGETVKLEPRDDPVSLDTPVQAQPEEYHASAMIHLEQCLGSNDGLEVLQAVLLLANFAMLRPVPPGLWYIVGAAVRLAIDLGLYYEDGAVQDEAKDVKRGGFGSRGRRPYVRDKKRRLWWCTYAFDRIVSTCVGRPLGITDQVITTEFPSLLDDDYITPNGFVGPAVPDPPSYKRVAYHYFRLRLLQSEMLQVLQHNQARAARLRDPNGPDGPGGARRSLPSPFLAGFRSFRDWRIDIDRRLWDWKLSAPSRDETGVLFSTEFLELNYWQAIIMLYRQSLSVPAMFEGEYNTSNEFNSPTGYQAELHEDEDRIYTKVAEAGQKIVRLYRQLHLAGLVSYTYLATHHLFMAGISYLYAIWHSAIVRSRLTMDEVDFAILAAKSVFTDMISRCPPAETCRDAFDRTARATIRMANAAGGFGIRAVPPQNANSHHGHDPFDRGTPSDRPSTGGRGARHQKQPSSQGFLFDLSLSDTLTSPSLSACGDASQSPSVGRPAGSDDSFAAGACGPQRPARDVASQSPAASLLPSPAMPAGGLPQAQGIGSASGGGAMLGGPPQSQPQSFVATPIDYGELQAMDILQSLQGTPTGEEMLMPSLLDVDFGFNWDGVPQFSDGQQVNLFNGFFFGGPGGGAGNAGYGTGMGGQEDQGNANGSEGTGMDM